MAKAVKPPPADVDPTPPTLVGESNDPDPDPEPDPPDVLRFAEAEAALISEALRRMAMLIWLLPPLADEREEERRGGSEGSGATADMPRARPRTGGKAEEVVVDEEEEEDEGTDDTNAVAGILGVASETVDDADLDLTMSMKRQPAWKFQCNTPWTEKTLNQSKEPIPYLEWIFF